MNLTNLAEIKTYLKLAKLKPNKKLGQHFLIDDQVLARIVKAANLKKTDFVLEVGPGLGVLTKELCKQVHSVVAIESDKNLANILKSNHLNNLQIINQNFLDFNLSQMTKRYKVVANLPYNITSKVFRKILDTPNSPQSIIALIQREVAERIVAGPGKMSILALSVQYFGEPKIIDAIKPSSFWPKPKVESAVFRVNVFDNPVFRAETKKLFHLIKAGFANKRKMLKNSLSGSFAKDINLISRILFQADINPTSRAQELSLNDWQKLYKICEKEKVI